MLFIFLSVCQALNFVLCLSFFFPTEERVLSSWKLNQPQLYIYSQTVPSFQEFKLALVQGQGASISKTGPLRYHLQVPVNLWNCSFGRFYPIDTVSFWRFLCKSNFCNKIQLFFTENIVVTTKKNSTILTLFMLEIPNFSLIFWNLPLMLKRSEVCYGTSPLLFF